MGNTISDPPSCPCFPKRLCCIIWTIWIRKWKPCAPTSRARPTSKDHGPVITLRWGGLCWTRRSSCAERSLAPLRPRPIPRLRPPRLLKARAPLLPLRRWTCSANRKRRKLVPYCGDQSLRFVCTLLPLQLKFCLWNFDDRREDYAFSCVIRNFHFPFADICGLFEEAG